MKTIEVHGLCPTCGQHTATRTINVPILIKQLRGKDATARELEAADVIEELTRGNTV